MVGYTHKGLKISVDAVIRTGTCAQVQATHSPVPLAAVSPQSEGGEPCRKTKPERYIRELGSQGFRFKYFNLNLKS